MLVFGSPLASSGPIECSWCGTSYARHQRNCTNCGGPLPGPTPPDPGPEPPPPPREIPGAYVRRLYLTGNVLTIIGGVFAFVGLPLVLIPGWLALTIAPEIGVASGVGLIFALIGVPMLGFGLRRARVHLHALREGRATRGMISEVYQDTREAINGRHPWAVVYTYEVNGRAYEGTVKSWARSGAILMLYAVRSPVHVLYVPEAPERSALYPPIR